MKTLHPDNDSSTTAADDTDNHEADGREASTGRTLTLLGGLSMLAAPLLFLGGAATSPPQTDNSSAAYIDSLGNDPFMTALSANLFHYSWVLFAFAALAAIGLVRGRRGRGLTVVGGLAGAFGAVQFTGLLYSDWVLEALDNQLSMTQAVGIFDHVSGTASISVWMLSAKLFGLLGFPVLFAGLARAGVISWWLVPLSLLPMVAFGVVGGVVGIILAVACYAPNFVTGARLVQRSRLAA
jgi:hypothetical protein